MKPEAGQWWFANDGSERCYIHGISSQGTPIYELDQRYVATSRMWEGWHHEPRCTGWDWVVPEEQPAEDPDEWVIQDRVPMRDVVDQGRYQLKETRPSHDAIWYALSDINMKTRGLMHGATHPYDPNCMLFVRCRRRDLPKVKPKTTDDFGMYLESVIAKDTQLKAEVDAAEAELAAIDARLNEQAEQWPKYYTPLEIRAGKVAFVRRDSAGMYTPVMIDGQEGVTREWHRSDNTLRKQLTEAEAMALLNKPEPDHIADASKKVSDETELDKLKRHYEHRGRRLEALTKKVRTLRRALTDYKKAQDAIERERQAEWMIRYAESLPQKPQPQPQKTRVRLWARPDGGHILFCHDKPANGSWQEIHHDSEGFYVEKHP